jgi:hypothetical protein
MAHRNAQEEACKTSRRGPRSRRLVYDRLKHILDEHPFDKTEWLRQKFYNDWLHMMPIIQAPE